MKLESNGKAKRLMEKERNSHVWLLKRREMMNKARERSERECLCDT